MLLSCTKLGKRGDDHVWWGWNGRESVRMSQWGVKLVKSEWVDKRKREYNANCFNWESWTIMLKKVDDNDDDWWWWWWWWCSGILSSNEWKVYSSESELKKKRYVQHWKDWAWGWAVSHLYCLEVGNLVIFKAKRKKWDSLSHIQCGHPS